MNNILKDDDRDAPLLKLQGVSAGYSHGGKKTTVVDDITLTLPRRRSLGIVGESGSGKSTLAATIVGLVDVWSGSMQVDGKQVDLSSKRDRRRLHKTVQLVFQDPYSAFDPFRTVGWSIADALRLRPDYKQLSRDATGAVGDLLERVSLPARFTNKRPHELSGGQLQRAGLARGLASGADLLILDEVTSGLDVEVQAKILPLIGGLKESLETNFIMISHDISVVASVCDDVVVLYGGQIMEVGATNQVLRDPRHPYTASLLSALPRGDSEPLPLSGPPVSPSDRPQGCIFHPRCPVGPTYRDGREPCIDEWPALAGHTGSEQTEGIGDLRCHFPLH